MYYKKELNQTKIAEKLGISRPKVSRLLAKARDKGIVKIEIVSPVTDTSYLESELAQKFNLKEVIIVDMTDEEPEAERKRTAADAALSFVERITTGSEYIGVSAGTTIHALAKRAQATAKENYKIIPIIGALKDTGKSFNANEISNLLSENMGGTSFLLNAPAFVKDSKTAAFFRNEDRIRKIFKLYDKLDLVLLGIGKADQKHPLIAGHLRGKELAKFKKLNTCGSISSIFFDQAGEILELPFRDRIIAISAEKLKKVEFKIGVALGGYKKQAILGALRSGLINVLVTDRSMAAWLKKQKQGV
ncbi:sugar-binding transcriptional regulator [Halanaerobium hydrogeniformans]|uniref:sugar-binding transcriptional regulator n=1 Tax=Halanaerobium hydrogeniformans TaxID=656519 RepID=UPI0002F32EC4|nr:sugar-binding domain-containing protein [Halanaerobium hydrogeniformans]